MDRRQVSAVSMSTLASSRHLVLVVVRVPLYAALALGSLGLLRIPAQCTPPSLCSSREREPPPAPTEAPGILRYGLFNLRCPLGLVVLPPTADLVYSATLTQRRCAPCCSASIADPGSREPRAVRRAVLPVPWPVRRLFWPSRGPGASRARLQK